MLLCCEQAGLSFLSKTHQTPVAILWQFSVRFPPLKCPKRFEPPSTLSFGWNCRRSFFPPPSLAQLHKNRVPGDYAAKRVTDWQRGAAGQACGYCRMECRPVGVGNVRILLA